MNKQCVTITIHAIQRSLGEQDESTLITQGDLYCKDSVTYLSYKESEATGFAGHTTTLKIEPTKVTLTRFGPRKTKLIIEPDAMHPCRYETGYGALDLTVLGKKISGQLTKTGDQIKLHYDLLISDDDPLENILTITVK